MTVRRSIERAFCIFSIKLAFFSAVIPGSALIRLITSSLVASTSCWLNGVGELLVDCLSFGAAVSCAEGVGLASGEGVRLASGKGVWLISGDAVGLTSGVSVERTLGESVISDRGFSFSVDSDGDGRTAGGGG